MSHWPARPLSRPADLYQSRVIPLAVAVAVLLGNRRHQRVLPHTPQRGTRYQRMQAEVKDSLWPVTDRVVWSVDAPDTPLLVPVVWPDTGQTTGTLDLPGR